MWPFDYIRRRKYGRRYKAALIVFLGAYMFERLDRDNKARVEAELSDNFNRTDTPAVAWMRVATWDLIAAFRAAAMDRIGIEPIIPGLSWTPLFKPWGFWRKLPEWPRRAFDARAAILIDEYRPMDQATADAKKFLRDNGMNIPDADPPAHGVTNVAA